MSDLKETESVTGLFTDATSPASSLSPKTLTTYYFYEDDDASTPPANDGLLRKLVDPLGHTTTFTYDERGNVLTVSDANANAADGTLVASVINTYYANGLLQTVTDALGHVTTYTYDNLGLVKTVTAPIDASNTAVTTNYYDAFGNVTTLNNLGIPMANTSGTGFLS